mgnify:CR=1 FL=1
MFLPALHGHNNIGLQLASRPLYPGQQLMDVVRGVSLPWLPARQAIDELFVFQRRNEIAAALPKLEF